MQIFDLSNEYIFKELQTDSKMPKQEEMLSSLFFAHQAILLQNKLVDSSATNLGKQQQIVEKVEKTKKGKENQKAPP